MLFVISPFVPKNVNVLSLRFLPNSLFECPDFDVEKQFLLCIRIIGKIHFAAHLVQEFFNSAPFPYLSPVVSNDAFT